MLWLVLSLMTALSQSLKDVFCKKNLKNLDEYTVAWAQRTLTGILLIPLLFFVGIPEFGSDFVKALIISGTINLFATVLYMKALKASDLSITVPMIAFSPLFLLFTSPLILGESASSSGIFGVILIVVGSYFLNIKHRKNGILYPFKALLHEKGPRIMLFIAFLWSISANYDKMGVVNSSPIFWSVSINLFISIILTPYGLSQKKEVKKFKVNFKKLIPIGIFTAGIFLTQMFAIKLTLVAYVISVKRMSIVFSVIFGYFIFKEKNVRERLTGAVIMVLGVVLISLG